MVEINKQKQRGGYVFFISVLSSFLWIISAGIFFLPQAIAEAKAVGGQEIDTHQTSIMLDGMNDEVTVASASQLQGFTQATWSMWVKQNRFVANAGIIGKYNPVSNGRVYLLRTVLTNSTSVIISGNGNQTEVQTSTTNKGCGVRTNNQWALITVTYNASLISYYRNGIICDTDATNISQLFSNTQPLRLGGGNNIFFNGSIDDSKIYNAALKPEQVLRLYDESPYGNKKGISIPVLVYHKLHQNATSRETVTPQNFTQQMMYLKQQGFKTVTLQEYWKWRQNQFSMPEKTVIIVFDDGFKTTYDVAFPVLQANNFIASVNVVTNYANGIQGVPSYMNWSTLQTLVQNKWGMESHGINHTNMLLIPDAEYRRQLQQSQQEIATKLQVTTPQSFTFPFGAANASITAVCGAYYNLCWTWSNEPDNPSYIYRSTPGTTYQSLRRITITNATTLQMFQDLLARHTNIVGEWKMNEGKGNITVDTSGNKNHGVLQGGASWGSG